MSDSPTILVVDDHRDIRDLVGRYLQEHGLRVLLADGGDAMKRQPRQQSVDLVVLDIMMPGDDGLTLCRYLREHTELPVILLTAMSEETDRIVGLEMGADDYLTKPFNPGVIGAHKSGFAPDHSAATATQSHGRAVSDVRRLEAGRRPPSTGRSGRC